MCTKRYAAVVWWRPRGVLGKTWTKRIIEKTAHRVDKVLDRLEGTRGICRCYVRILVPRTAGAALMFVFVVLWFSCSSVVSVDIVIVMLDFIE